MESSSKLRTSWSTLSCKLSMSVSFTCGQTENQLKPTVSQQLMCEKLKHVLQTSQLCREWTNLCSITHKSFHHDNSFVLNVVESKVGAELIQSSQSMMFAVSLLQASSVSGVDLQFQIVSVLWMCSLIISPNSKGWPPKKLMRKLFRWTNVHLSFNNFKHSVLTLT